MQLFSKTFLPFLLTSLAWAQAAPQTATRKAMFWKVTSPTSVTWLLGSVHLGSKDMYPLAKEIEDAFESSTAVLVEADARKIDMAKIQASLFAKGLYQAPDSLWEHITPDTRKKLEAFCEKFQFPCVNLAPLKPWVVSLTIATVPMMKAGMDPKLGIDLYFLNRSDKKRVVEIESADMQMDLISGFSDEDQDKLLAASAEEGLQMEDKTQRIREVWSSGDTVRLEAITRESTKTPEKITRAILQDRNPHMADVAEQFLKGKETTFLIVGAAHMVGKEGIVALLQQRGYKVEQVSLRK